jgi:hypothetical protein
MAAAVDKFGDRAQGLDSPQVHAFAIATSDTVDLPFVTREVYVGTTGDITAIMAGGETVLFKTVPVGRYPWRFSRVKTTGTTAATMVGLY